MNPARAMRLSLFRSGLAPRLAATALYGGLALGAVLLLEPSHAARDARATAADRAPTPGATPLATLCLESLQPVGSWSVRLDGAALTPRRSDGSTWIADIALPPDAALVIDAAPAGEMPATRNALRIRIAGTPVSRDQTFWCGREWSVTTPASRLTPAAAPIAAEDLP